MLLFEIMLGWGSADDPLAGLTVCRASGDSLDMRNEGG